MIGFYYIRVVSDNLLGGTRAGLNTISKICSTNNSALKLCVSKIGKLVKL